MCRGLGVGAAAGIAVVGARVAAGVAVGNGATVVGVGEVAATGGTNGSRKTQNQLSATNGMARVREITSVDLVRSHR